MKKMITVCAVVLVCSVCAVLWASPAVGVTPTLIGRATYEPFKVKSNSLVEVEVKAKSHLDMVVRTARLRRGRFHRLAYPPGSCVHQRRAR